MCEKITHGIFKFHHNIRFPFIFPFKAYKDIKNFPFDLEKEFISKNF